VVRAARMATRLTCRCLRPRGRRWLLSWRVDRL
jgi:hypothetical protein